MNRSAQQLRQAVLAALLLFVSSMLAVTGYTLWRLRHDAIVSGLELATMHAKSFEDMLTQSLHVTELVAANILPQAAYRPDLRQIEKTFVTTLRRAPFLRSLSLLDENDLIVASSNPANVGLTLRTQSYLPLPTGSPEILRIGTPWAGRDFAGGRASTFQAVVEGDAPSFIPVTQTLVLNKRRLTLLVALNPDYFINHIAQKLDTWQGSVEIVRYDGTRLMATDPRWPPGARHDVGALRLGEVESGQFQQDSGKGHKTLTAYRSSRLYPVVLLTNINREYALRHWETEAKTLLSVVLTVLTAISLLSFAYYRRQLQLSEQRAESQRLQRINATVFDSSTEAILIADDNAQIVSLNAAFTRVTGHRAEDLVGRPVVELLTDEGIATFKEKIRQRQNIEQQGAAGDSAGFEVQQRCTDGTLIWTEIHSTPERDASGTVVGYHRIFRNITGRKQMEDQVRQLAFHDTLTQLPNRRLLVDRLSQAMAASGRSACYSALMFLDLDNFKSLNDLHGHGVGDLLLIETAHRLKCCVREADTVARFGGDEFVVMLGILSTDRSESTAQAAAIAEKIRSALSAPYRLALTAGAPATIEHRCSASIGVVLFVNHRASQDELLKWADAAMYQAKAAGRNQIRFHDSPPRAGAPHRGEVDCSEQAATSKLRTP